MPSRHTISNKPEKREKLENQPFDEDLPGGGQHYCVPCDKHCASAKDKEKHMKGKSHKQRVKELAKGPAFTPKEAEEAF